MKCNSLGDVSDLVTFLGRCATTLWNPIILVIIKNHVHSPKLGHPVQDTAKFLYVEHTPTLFDIKFVDHIKGTADAKNLPDFKITDLQIFCLFYWKLIVHVCHPSLFICRPTTKEQDLQLWGDMLDINNPGWTNPLISVYNQTMDHLCTKSCLSVKWTFAGAQDTIVFLQSH